MGGDETGSTRVVDNTELSRYEIYLGDTLAGFTKYKARPGALIMLHSEVFPEFEHHGLASELARATLDDIRAKGLQVVPRCPFVARYIREHPEYADLVSDIT